MRGDSRRGVGRALRAADRPRGVSLMLWRSRGAPARAPVVCLAAMATSRHLFVVILAIALVACGGATFAMRAAPSELSGPASDVARVVFVVTGGTRDPFAWVDERGTYLGQTRGGTYLAIDVAPGAHRFYALRGASAYVVRAEALSGGRTYYVHASAGGLASASVRALRPRDGDRWSQRAGWLASSERVEIDPSADAAALRRQLGNVPQRMLEADAELEAMSDALRAERVLEADDGLDT